MKRLKRNGALVALLVLAGVTTLGCQSDSGNGTLIGSGAGAGAGALIGSNVSGRGKRTQGALIGAGAGALIGGVTGYLVGREGDIKAEQRMRERDRDDRYYTPVQSAPPGESKP